MEQEKRGAIPLPQGVFVMSEAFRDMEEGEVVFPFRGTEYSARIGVNAFGHLTELSERADKAPDEPFCGRSFDTAVVLIPAGVHNCPMKGAFLPVELRNPLTILGEAMGISPNAPGDVRKPNPARNTEESVLCGSFYYGTLALPEGVPGVLTLDGLTLHDTTVSDRRTAGKGLGIEVRNCIFANSFGRTVIAAAPLADAQARRVVTVSDCRADGLDSRDAEGRFLNGCFTRLTVERLYYAHTKKFFGLTDYQGKERNAAPGGTLDFTLRECVFEAGDCVHGLTVAAPGDCGAVRVTAEDCVFDKFASEGDPTLRVDLPGADSALTLRRCKLSGKGAAAVIVDGSRDAAVTLEDTAIDGYAEQYAYKPPRRTEAPEKIGQVVWGNEKLDDPHTPCGEEESEEALRWLDCLYSDRSARFGDMHVHTNSGGKSDGKTPLAEFVRQIKALGLDFAAVVDHKQIRHALLPEWDDELLICGTEPGARIVEEGRAKRSQVLHYTLIFRRPTDFYRLMEAFPEYNYTGGTDGYCGYPSFTPERFREVIDFVYHLGGTVAHAHPKQQMASDDPLHYYFGDRMPLETVLGHAEAYSTVQNVRLWETLLKMGKRVHTRGDSDTHQQAKNCAITTAYTLHRRACEVLDAVRSGDCTAGCIGIQTAIDCVRMGSHLPWHEGQKLAIRVKDYYRPGMKENTVYCLKVFTDRGLAYASEFDGTQPQVLVLPVEKRAYYRVEVTNESDGAYVAVSNPIWLD